MLEHIADSDAFLRGVTRWVRPGGHIAIEVPNFDSVQRKVEGSSWRGLRPLEHIVHFTPATLATAFRHAGLEPVLVRSPTWLGRPQTLDYAVGDLCRPRLLRWMRPLTRAQEVDGERVRYPTRAGWKVLRAAESAYDRRGQGAVVFGIARVPPAP